MSYQDIHPHPPLDAIVDPVDVEQAAALFDVKPQTVRTWANRGLIPKVATRNWKVGPFSRAWLQDWGRYTGRLDLHGNPTPAPCPNPTGPRGKQQELAA